MLNWRTIGLGRLAVVSAPLLAVVSLLAPTRAQGAAPTAFSLMKRSDKWHRLPIERTESTLLLQKKGEKQRKRQLVSLAVQDDRTGDRMRMRFLVPPNIKGTAMLTVENKAGGDDEQWLYLPAFRRTRRIGATELGDRFVGTDFFYEDMKRRHVEEYKHKILRSETVDGHECWVIESRPKDPKVIKESPYGKRIIWLRKDILFAVRGRMFDTRLRPWKEVRAGRLRKVKGKAWRADEVMMMDIRRNHRTTILTTKRTIDGPIASGTFTKHKLADPL